ncbi:hypothetical protein VHEMI09381 [[Torrubiella] hemipterigena]|uniref:Chromo domain-containing protein n=2 Tax=[Torrubiella] hemipterigena TaxID=1531966 RepID=A0A0A1TQ84_9HYPO|nr:hypothetical protein VHEMI09381 [[Torrubiella] hemipterigena]
MVILGTAPEAATVTATTTSNNRTARARIDIPVPNAYTPGSGPPLQKLRLQPPSDSEAYIIERILLPSPGLARDGKPLPKRMTYIVGWKNQPAARLLVPVLNILDYVSPFVFEQFEFDTEMKLEERRASLEKDKQAGKKRPERPPKSHGSNIESAVVVTAESDLRRPKSGTMSLSTPTKRKIQDLEEVVDDESSSSRQEQPGYAAITAEGSPAGSQAAADAQVWAEVKHGDILVEDSESDEDSFPLIMPPETPLMSRVPNSTSEVHEAWLQPPSSSASKAAKPNPPKPNYKKPVPKIASPETEEEEWTVKRLDDMNEYIVEGRGRVRYFKVLWEGNWPPDKNPTWEPEANLPKALVKEFLKEKAEKEKARRLAKPKDTPSGLKQTKLSWPFAP